MKKRLFSLFCIFVLSVGLCLTAAATQVQPTANESFAQLLAVSASGMETNTLTAGVGDAVTLKLYVNVDDTQQTAFTLQYDDSVFTMNGMTVQDTDGQCTLTTTGVSAGLISFNYQYNKAGALQGAVGGGNALVD